LQVSLLQTQVLPAALKYMKEVAATQAALVPFAGLSSLSLFLSVTLSAIPSLSHSCKRFFFFFCSSLKGCRQRLVTNLNVADEINDADNTASK
jgi:hypothetical protein